MKIVDECEYSLPAIIKLIPKTAEELVLQTTVPVIPVREASGVVSQYMCKENPKCLNMVDENTVLMCSDRGRAHLCTFNRSTYFMDELTASPDKLIQAINYCEDLILLPQSRFLLASGKDLTIASYNLPQNQISLVKTCPHYYDFVAKMANQQDSVLMACLSKCCVLWSVEYSSPVQKFWTEEDPIAIDYIQQNNCVFMCGGYGSGSIYFYDIRTKRRVLEVNDQKCQRLTCLKSIMNYVFSGIGVRDQKLCLYDIRNLKGVLAIQRMSNSVTGISKFENKVAVATRRARVAILKIL